MVYWPQNRGFDSHYGFLLGAQTYFDHSRDNGYDFRDGEEVAWEANGTYSTYLIQERAKKIIRWFFWFSGNHKFMIFSEHDSDTPLFLYVPFQAVHGPLEVPEVYKDLYQDVEVYQVCENSYLTDFLGWRQKDLPRHDYSDGWCSWEHYPITQGE